MRSALSRLGRRSIRWLRHRARPAATTGWLAIPSRPEFVVDGLVSKRAGQHLLEVSLILDIPIDAARRYDHSILFLGIAPDYQFRTEKAIAFRVPYLRTPQTLRIVVPEEVIEATEVRVRIDPLPGGGPGQYQVFDVGFRDDDQSDLTRDALLESLKDRTRRAVEISEAESAPICGHYPHSINLELTARCNFACPFCSTHGTPEVKARSQRIASMSIDTLDRLAAEVFPALSSVCVVGRGEPTVASDELWSAFTERVARHRVMVAIATNGSMLRRRITPELLPWIDSIEVAIDGATEETLARNRVGGSWAKLREGLDHFHEMRMRSNLARLPRLAIGFIAMRNNVAELPELVRMMLPYKPDRFIVRHLMIYFDKDRGESLIGHEDYANPYFQEAYALLAEHGIRSDCVPLMKKASEPAATPLDPALPVIAPPAMDEGCMFIHRTSVVMCDGDVWVCPVPHTKLAGRFEGETRFLEIWNGANLQDVRSRFGTPSEWDVCKNCFYREGRYKSQRARADARQTRYDLTQGSVFTSKTWDFAARRGA
jgi:MoaA/NifB/PqqE/SkfB family radical SAM enzyme